MPTYHGMNPSHHITYQPNPTQHNPSTKIFFIALFIGLTCTRDISYASTDLF